MSNSRILKRHLRKSKLRCLNKIRKNTKNGTNNMEAPRIVSVLARIISICTAKRINFFSFTLTLTYKKFGLINNCSLLSKRLTEFFKSPFCPKIQSSSNFPRIAPTSTNFIYCSKLNISERKNASKLKLLKII